LYSLSISVVNQTSSHGHLLLSFGHNEIKERRRRSAGFENNFVSLQKRPKNKGYKMLTINALRNALKKVAICMHYLANFG
jgi:hypothetical protein